jgi:hypothetical protein
MVLPSRRAPGSSPRAAQQDTRQPLKWRREARWHSPSRCCGSIKRKFERRQTRLLSTLRPPAQTNAQVAALMAPGLGRFDSEPPATSERTTLLKDVREPGALREIFGLNGVTRNLIRHLRLDKLNQRGGLPLRLPGEPSRRRPQDRSHPHPYRKPLNPSPRPREPSLYAANGRPQATTETKAPENPRALSRSSAVGFCPLAAKRGRHVEAPKRLFRLSARTTQLGRQQPVRAALIAAGIGRCATRCRFPSSYSCRGR